MVASDALGVWLYGIMVARVTRQRGRLRLDYTEDALSRYDLGLPLLSLSLPLGGHYTHLPVSAFLDGLLPEGDSRRVVARDVGIRPTDTYGLIQALGRDCAGAVIIQPVAEPAPPPATTLTAKPLAAEGLAELVANLREAPLGAGGRVRISLAGVQEKLLLTEMPGGAWGQPVDGTPSTHILKPEIARFPSTVENEAFCMRLAKQMGLNVANVATTAVNNRKLVVVERYDRVRHPDGSVDRIHQEDFCQATATPPSDKYEGDGGPSFKTLAGILQAVADPTSVDSLLQAVILTVLVGNGDAHAKNFSLLHEPSGIIRLAPLYDQMSTLLHGDERLAMFVDNVRQTRRVTAGRILNEAASWGMSKRRATEVVADFLQRVPHAIDAAADETPGVPLELLTIVQSQLQQILQGEDTA